jgi:uncharacterized protein
MASNAEVVKGIYESMGKGDVGAMLATFDEKIEWLEPESLPYEDQVGPQAIAENTLSKVVQDIQDFSLNMAEIHDAGDVIFALGTYRGTGTAGGKALEAPYVHVWRLRDGKVTGFRTYTDTHNWLQALGKA